jgi:hypothetical protein
MADNIFRKESMQQVSSPEQLNDYIKVSNPGVWIVLIAILVFFGAAAVWAVTAVIPTLIPARAVADARGRYVCYLPVEIGENLKPGITVQIGSLPGKVTRVEGMPLSYNDAIQSLPNEYAAHTLGLLEWNIRVEIQLDSVEEAQPVGTISPVTITADTVRPLSFLFN